MLTRGKIIGELLDGFSQLSFVLNTRSSLGLYDLNKYCENFVRDLLNIIYDYNLENLNEYRSNEPGLDLGDSISKVAFQVTSEKTSAKINATLEKITKEQTEKYKTFYVLILGVKQKTYDSIDKFLAVPLNFTSKNILDITNLERKIINLDTKKLSDLNNITSKEFIKLLSDFESNDSTTNEETSFSKNVEIKPPFIYKNCKSLIHFTKKEHNFDLNEGNLNESFKNLIITLLDLPKITREFFYAIISRSDYNNKYDSLAVRYEIIKRIIKINMDDINEELHLLTSYGLLQILKSDDYENYIVFNQICKKDNVLLLLKEFADGGCIDLKSAIIELNFNALSSN